MYIRKAKNFHDVFEFNSDKLCDAEQYVNIIYIYMYILHVCVCVCVRVYTHAYVETRMIGNTFLESIMSHTLLPIFLHAFFSFNNSHPPSIQTPTANRSRVHTRAVYESRNNTQINTRTT